MNKFDELAKVMAQSVTRRAALKKFGVGLAGMALACFGLVNRAEAGRNNQCYKKCYRDCVAQGGYPATCDYACFFKCPF